VCIRHSEVDGGGGRVVRGRKKSKGKKGKPQGSEKRVKRDIWYVHKWALIYK
jgi:hypothetical protein